MRDLGHYQGDSLYHPILITAWERVKWTMGKQNLGWSPPNVNQISTGNS